MQAKKARKSARKTLKRRTAKQKTIAKRKTAATKGGASIQVVYSDALREAMARRGATVLHRVAAYTLIAGSVVCRESLSSGQWREDRRRTSPRKFPSPFMLE